MLDGLQSTVQEANYVRCYAVRKLTNQAVVVLALLWMIIPNDAKCG